MTTALRPGRRSSMPRAGDEFFSSGTDLKELAELDVSAERVRRATERIGGERVAERDAQAAVYEALPIPERRRAPADQPMPAVACVQMDGGRLQVFDRVEPNGTTRTPSPANESRLLVEHEQRSFHGRSLSAVAGIVRGSGENATNGAGNQGFFGPRRFRGRGGGSGRRTRRTSVPDVRNRWSAASSPHAMRSRRSANFW